MCQLMGDDHAPSDGLQGGECLGIDDNTVPLCPLVRVDHALGDRCHLIEPLVGGTEEQTCELLRGGRCHDHHVSVPVLAPHPGDPANGRVDGRAVVAYPPSEYVPGTLTTHALGPTRWARSSASGGASPTVP